MKEHGTTHSDMISWLSSMSCEVSNSTLMRRFQKWGLRKNTTEPVTEQLVDRVKDIYHHDGGDMSELARREERRGPGGWQREREVYDCQRIEKVMLVRLCK